MALPPWTIELLRRGITDVARKASEPETIEKIKNQATEILQDLPQTAAKGIDAMMRTAEVSKKTVERWSRKHTALAVPLLNGSGVLMNEHGSGVPLAPQVSEAGYELMLGDSVSGASMDERLSQRLQRLLPAGGDYSIAVTSNFSSALTALALLVEERQLVVHRSQAVRLPNGRALPDAFGMFLPVVQEVGSRDNILPQDFDGLESFCVVMADVGEKPLELLELGGRDAMQAVILPVATLGQAEWTVSGAVEIPSAESMLVAGADFVVLAGQGVLGGPECGIVIGRKPQIDRIKSSRVWPSIAAGDAARAMLAMTLEVAASNPDEIPALALLSTSEENLRGRAERLATRLSGSDDIRNVQITAEDARLIDDGRWRLPSRQICVTHESIEAKDWQKKLLEDLLAIAVNCHGDAICVDLRWISASDDSRLAEALGGAITTGPSV
jgi:L-seryl-tRNA(Ser) seleniumtransferase